MVTSVSLTSLFPSVFQSLLDSLFSPADNLDPVLLPSGHIPGSPASPGTPMLVVCNTQPAPPILPPTTDSTAGSLVDLFA